MGNSLSSGTIEINNFEELLEFAEAGVKPGQKQLKLSPELGVLVIHVEGEGYGNFIPGEQLRSLWQIQEDFFRLAAYALHGTTDIRTLTPDERQLFEIKLTTKDGSWLENIPTSEFWNAIFANTVGKMDGGQIEVTIAICVFLVSGVLIYKSRDKRLVAIEQEKTKQSEFNALSATIAKGQELLAGGKSNSYIERTGQAIDDAAIGIAKRSRGANSISVAGRKLNKEEIEQLKSRSKTEREEPSSVSSVFNILAVDKSTDVWVIKVQDVDGLADQPMLVRLSPEAINDESDEGRLAQEIINDAFYKGNKVNLEILLRKKQNLLINASEYIQEGE